MRVWVAVERRGDGDGRLRLVVIFCKAGHVLAIVVAVERLLFEIETSGREADCKVVDVDNCRQDVAVCGVDLRPTLRRAPAAVEACLIFCIALKIN